MENNACTETYEAIQVRDTAKKTSWKHPGTGVTQVQSSIEFGEKLSLVHFKSFSRAHDIIKI